MKTSERILTNNSVGLYTMVKDLQDGKFSLFTTKDNRGLIRNTMWCDKEADTLLSSTYEVSFEITTIIDWHAQARGPENLVLGFGAETDEQCEEMLVRLTEGQTEVSFRHRIPLRIESLKLHR